MNPELDSYSAFLGNDKLTETGLFNLLPKGAELYICGIATDVCVFNTAMDALKGAFSTISLIEDACAAVTEEGRVKSLETMYSSGIEKRLSKDLLEVGA
jgi:nicotinamidase/pyrazinamidase